jgi:hypothetical protein
LAAFALVEFAGDPLPLESVEPVPVFEELLEFEAVGQAGGLVEGGVVVAVVQVREVNVGRWPVLELL